MTGASNGALRISPADEVKHSPPARQAIRQTPEINRSRSPFSRPKPGHPKSGTPRWQHFLPGIIGLLALAIYLCTLSPGLSLSQLTFVAQLAGWNSTPVTSQPLLWLLTVPLRWLPPRELPLAANVAAAVLAALTLGLLTRSVQILPLNRLHVQRMFLANRSGRFRRPDAWLPPVLAAVICGLSYSFWCEATVGTGEMFDLLLLSAMLWCLLEHHASRKKAWQTGAFFLAGLNLAENWLTQLPLLAILAVMTLLSADRSPDRNVPLVASALRAGANQSVAAAEVQRFFWHCLRLGAWLAAGFATLAILPLINWLTPSIHWSLWQGVTGTWGSLKQDYISLYWNFRTSTLDIKLLLGLAVVSPVFPLLLKLRHEPSYQKSAHGRLQLLGLHLFYALCLTGCLWLALEPDFGPQAVVLKTWNLPTPLLGWVYLNALGAGYLAAHFLLIFGADLSVIRRQNPHFRPPPFLPAASPWMVRPAIFTLPLVLAGLLVAINTPAILHDHRHPLDEYGHLTLQSLPSTGGLLLVDDPLKRMAIQSATSDLPLNPWQVAATAQIGSATFRQQLKLLPSAATSPADAAWTNPVAWLYRVSAVHPVFYLPAATDNLLEWFHADPAVIGWALTPKFPAAVPSAMSPAAFAAGEEFWNAHWESIHTACRPSTASESLLAPVLKCLALRLPPDDQSRLAAEWYSAAVNNWAVQLQRNGHVLEAGPRFAQAIALNPANFSARINLSVNQDLKTGQVVTFDNSAEIIGQLTDTRQLLKLLARCGPVDDPLFCCLLGSIFTHQKLPHQASEQLERARAVSPTALAPGLLLAELYAGNGQAEALRDTFNQLESLVANRPQNQRLTAKLAEFETKLKSPPQTGNPYQSPALANPGGPTRLCQNDLNDALVAINRQLADSPADFKARVNQAGILIIMGQLTNGLNRLNEILAATNLPLARLDRAGVELKLGQLAAAETDYRILEQSGPASFQANYGLARVAAARHDTNQTMLYLQSCLATAPDQNTRSKVNSALQELLKHDK